MRNISLGQLTDIERLINSWSILIKTMPIFKTLYLGFGVIFRIKSTLLKKIGFIFFKKSCFYNS